MRATEFGPVGIVGDSDRVVALARKLASEGRRVLLHMPRGIAMPEPIKRVERVATPTDIAFECTIVLVDIRDGATFRDTVIGTPDRMGLGAEMQPGTQIIDMAVRPPRDLQAILGLLGTRGISVLDAALKNASYLKDSPFARAILLGGFPEAVAEAEPTLALLAPVVRTGPLGSAHTTAAIAATVELQVSQALQSAAELAAHLRVPDALSSAYPALLHDEDFDGGTNRDELVRRAWVADVIAAQSGFGCNASRVSVAPLISAIAAADAVR